MSQLFPDIPTAESSPHACEVVSVAVNANLWRSFDYLWPAELGRPEPGQRVRVPFGRSNRDSLGFVVAIAAAPAGERKLKHVREIVDGQSLLDETLWKLGNWISQYYLTPLGMVLSAMIPSVVGKHGPRMQEVAFLTAERHDWPCSLGGRQKRVLDELYEARKQGIEPLAVEALQAHSGSSRDTIKRLAGRGLIRLELRPVVLEGLGGDGEPAGFELNADQAAALGSLQTKLEGGFSGTLLYGVTGSGKTEVYVRLIRQVVQAGRQAILLVPEIALATQTLQRLIKRLPRVAVIHSALTGVEREFHYDQIRQGNAAVVIGPRSAIFAPARKLGLIVVDEEHEPSYKQDTAPRYHGRDTAVMRAMLAGVPIVLGSATPSLESLHNVRQGRYEMLRLPHRVRGLPMPRLQIVHLRKEMQTPGPGPRRIELIGGTLTRKIAAALDRSEQVILLMNRRGYASYVFCPSCGWIMTCPNCTRAMVFHQAVQLGMCHYCEHTEALPESCVACGKKLLLFGFGIQRIESELASKFPTARVARMDSDTMTSPRQFQKVFNEFSRGELDILLGTQMVAKGLDFPRVSLVGVVSADTSLTIPDFRAAERTFQLIVQVAGRAGRKDVPGEVVVQTLHAQEPAILFAAQHDYDGFAGAELPMRQQTNLPPFSRLVRFVCRHESQDKAEQSAGTLAARLRELLPAGVSFTGPMPAGVKKVNNQFRFQIVLGCQRAGAIQQRLAGRMEEIVRELPADVAADVDPVSLM